MMMVMMIIIIIIIIIMIRRIHKAVIHNKCQHYSSHIPCLLRHFKEVYSLTALWTSNQKCSKCLSTLWDVVYFHSYCYFLLPIHTIYIRLPRSSKNGELIQTSATVFPVTVCELMCSHRDMVFWKSLLHKTIYYWAVTSITQHQLYEY